MSMFRATFIPFLNDDRKTFNLATPWRGIDERDALSTNLLEEIGHPDVRKYQI